MSVWIVGGIIVYAFGLLFVWSLCRAAARADAAIEQERRRRWGQQ